MLTVLTRHNYCAFSKAKGSKRRERTKIERVRQTQHLHLVFELRCQLLSGLAPAL